MDIGFKGLPLCGFLFGFVMDLVDKGCIPQCSVIGNGDLVEWLDWLFAKALRLPIMVRFLLLSPR